jgi:hypothetical protein
MALRTPNPGEASLKPATGQELLHRANHNRAQWSRAGFEAFLITSDITVEVVFEKLVKSRVLGMSRPVFRSGFRNDPAGGTVGAKEKIFESIGPNNDRLVGQWHGRQQTSRGCRAALDLTAATGFEPSFCRKRGGAGTLSALPGTGSGETPRRPAKLDLAAHLECRPLRGCVLPRRS